MEQIRYEEALALAELHRQIIKRMRDSAGATFSSSAELPAPKTIAQEDILEDEGDFRIKFQDGSAIVIGSEAHGFHMTLGIHSSRVEDDDPFQGFRFITTDADLDGYHLPKQVLN